MLVTAVAAVIRIPAVYEQLAFRIETRRRSCYDDITQQHSEAQHNSNKYEKNSQQKSESLRDLETR